MFPLSTNISQLVERGRDNIHKIKGVVGSGITHSEVTGIGTGHQVIVYLEKMDYTVIAQLPEQINGIPVLYEVIGEVKAIPCSLVDRQCVCTGYTATFQERYRPLQPGTGITNIQRLLVNNMCNVGTLGVVAIRNADRVPVILSNNHVIAYDNPGSRIGNVGDIIIQPGTLDNGNTIHDRVATLAEWIPITNQGSGNNTVDCAYALIDSGVVYYNMSLCNYFIGRSIQPTGNMAIKKTGRTTGCTNGTIVSYNVTVNVNYSLTSTPAYATFTGQLRTSDNFTAAGDSGSVVVNSNTDEAVGLLYASDSNGAAVLNIIQDVENALDITIGCSIPIANMQVI